MKLVTSRDNGFFKELKRMNQSGRERRKTGKMILDGVHLIEAYERCVAPVETLVICEGATSVPEVAALIGDRQFVTLSKALFHEVAVVESPSGVMAVAPTPVSPVPDPAVDTILLDGVQDPGNVGTLIRTAAAAGFRQVVLSPDCAAAWSPKVLRAGQGGHFALAVIQEADLCGFLSTYQGTAILTDVQATLSLYDSSFGAAVAWVFGSEGQGVRDDVRARVPLAVRIPMPGAIESLNVSAAAAICLYETVRRRL